MATKPKTPTIPEIMEEFRESCDGDSRKFLRLWLDQKSKDYYKRYNTEEKIKKKQEEDEALVNKSQDYLINMVEFIKANQAVLRTHDTWRQLGLRFCGNHDAYIQLIRDRCQRVLDAPIAKLLELIQHVGTFTGWHIGRGEMWRFFTMWLKIYAIDEEGISAEHLSFLHVIQDMERLYAKKTIDFTAWPEDCSNVEYQDAGHERQQWGYITEHGVTVYGVD